MSEGDSSMSQGDPKVTLTTTHFVMVDTGIGRDAGYANDKELLAAVEAERAALDPEVREALERVERDVARAMLGVPEADDR